MIIAHTTRTNIRHRSLCSFLSVENPLLSKWHMSFTGNKDNEYGACVVLKGRWSRDQDRRLPEAG